MIALACFCVALGIWFVLSALLNWEWYLGIADYAFVEAIFGDNAARWLFGLTGLVVIGFGIYLVVQ